MDNKMMQRRILFPNTVAFGGAFLAGAAFGAGEQLALRPNASFGKVIKRSIGFGLQTGGAVLGAINVFVVFAWMNDFK